MRRGLSLALALALAGSIVLLPDTALAAGNDIGRNVGGTLRQIAGEVYGGIIGIVGLIFLLNRRFTDLAMFLLAAVLVGWLVFSPDQVAAAARALAGQILP